MCFLWVSHKGETAGKDDYIKGTGPRFNVGAGDLRASGRSDLKGSLPAGGGYVRYFHKNSTTLDHCMTESGRGGSPYSFPQGTLAQWVEQRLRQPWVIGSSPIGSTPRRRGRSIKNRCARGDVIFLGETMITRQDKRRVLEALDERLLMELVIHPVDAFCDTWDYGHYRLFRRLTWAGDWLGLTRALNACPETAVVETTLTLIKDASPRLYAMVST